MSSSKLLVYPRNDVEFFIHMFVRLFIFYFMEEEEQDFYQFSSEYDQLYFEILHFTNSSSIEMPIHVECVGERSYVFIGDNMIESEELERYRKSIILNARPLYILNTV